MIEKLLTLKEAAPLLGIKPRTLRLWVQEKDIPHYVISGRPKFRETELAEFINRKRVEVEKKQELSPRRKKMESLKRVE